MRRNGEDLLNIYFSLCITICSAVAGVRSYSRQPETCDLIDQASEFDSITEHKYIMGVESLRIRSIIARAHYYKSARKFSQYQEMTASIFLRNRLMLHDVYVYFQ